MPLGARRDETEELVVTDVAVTGAFKERPSLVGRRN
jgi:hypothetical protein